MTSILDTIADRFGYTRKAAGASIIPVYADSPAAKPREPKWDYYTLYDEAERNWVVQAAVQTLIREVLRPGWNPYTPKFVSKCNACGEEFAKMVDECPICGGTDIRKPDPRQKEVIRRIIETPNRNRETWRKILYSILYHDLIADRWFMSIAYAPIISKDGDVMGYKPSELYVEDPKVIEFVMDARGRLGAKPYVCPHCLREDMLGEDASSDDIQYISYEEGAVCPVCGRPMLPTTYVQKYNDKTYLRFTDIEMIHGSTYRPSPDPDSQPRLVSAWSSLQTMKAMDEWFYDTYSEGMLGKIVFNPSLSQNSMDELAASIRSQIKALDQTDATTGEARVKKTARILFLGGGGSGKGEAITVHNLMDDPTAMKAIEYYNKCVSAILSVYGIQASFVNVDQRSGGSGSMAVKLEVQNHVVEALQRDKEDAINTQLYRILGVTDYEFRFNPVVQRDALVEAQIQQIKASAMSYLLSSGVDFEVDENWVIVPRGKPVHTPQQSVSGEGTTPQKPQVSDRTGRVIEGTTVQRNPFNMNEDNRGEGDSVVPGRGAVR